MSDIQRVEQKVDKLSDTLTGFIITQTEFNAEMKSYMTVKDKDCKAHSEALDKLSCIPVQVKDLEEERKARKKWLGAILLTWLALASSQFYNWFFKQGG